MINSSLRFKLPHEVPFLVIQIHGVWSNANESVPVVGNRGCDFIDCNELNFGLSHSIEGLEEDSEVVGVDLTFESGIFKLLAIVHLHTHTFLYS